jgi:hypothetical protein
LQVEENTQAVYKQGKLQFEHTEKPIRPMLHLINRFQALQELLTEGTDAHEQKEQNNMQQSARAKESLTDRLDL